MLPFSLSCASQSSVSVVQNQRKKAQNEQNPINEDGVGRKGNNLTKSAASSSLQLPRPSFFFSPGLQKLAKGFKRFSNLFAIYREKEEEEEGVEMEIGCPTDVRHVAHIGWDGLNNVGGMRWEKAPEFFPLSSLSLREFQLAMDSQGEGDGPL